MDRDITAFCMKPGSNPRFAAFEIPVVIDSWQYATDGHVVIRQPIIQRGPNDKRMGLPEMFADFPKCLEPWPKKHKTTDIDYKADSVVMAIGNRYVAVEYCLLIESLGDVLFCPDGKENDPVAFVCNELQGLVMPISVSRRGRA